jgi:hypothetical protein
MSFALLGRVIVVALPGGALALLVGRRAQRMAAFWIAAAGALALALPLRIFLVLRPYLPTAELPLWSRRFGLILAVPHFATALLAALGLLASYLRASRLREGLVGARGVVRRGVGFDQEPASAFVMKTLFGSSP